MVFCASWQNMWYFCSTLPSIHIICVIICLICCKWMIFINNTGSFRVNIVIGNLFEMTTNGMRVPTDTAHVVGGRDKK